MLGIAHAYANITHAGATALYYTYTFGTGSGPIHITQVGCTGIETRLVNCRYSTDTDGYDYYYYYYQYRCYHYNDAGVRCLRGVNIDSVVEYSKLP